MMSPTSNSIETLGFQYPGRRSEGPATREPAAGFPEIREGGVTADPAPRPAAKTEDQAGLLRRMARRRSVLYGRVGQDG